MKKELFQEIEIPEGVEAEIEGSTLKVMGKEGENKKTFKINKLKFEKKDNKIIIGYGKATKKEKKLM
ncbi:MAG TPA: 50S ribosomal protein L6, partial [Candidatus Pacearchaeota archaeon]|nr:50S ribosomal protein L6 [Candidatus Pacearchaeota archaeon]